MKVSASLALGWAAKAGRSELQPEDTGARASRVLRFYFFKVLLPVDSPIISLRACVWTVPLLYASFFLPPPRTGLWIRRSRCVCWRKESIFLSVCILISRWCSRQKAVFVCLFVLLFRATPAAYGSSQARGQIGAADASLCHSLQQRWILYPLSEARDRICMLMGTSRLCNPLSHNRNSHYSNFWVMS